jgi:lipoate-protein ligase A
MATPWRLVLDGPRPAAENMALDEALLERAQTAGDAVLRIYGWSSPSLSLGRNQPARGRYALDRAAALGVSFVRRPTGGRAVLHFREVTYSVTAPRGALGSLGESYARINRLLVGGLRRLGVPAEVAAPEVASPPPGIAPCFETPVAGEIVAAGRKLVGSAQLRDRGAILQHGSILVEDDQMLASDLLCVPVAPPPAPATLSALLGRVPDYREVAIVLLDAVRELEDPAAQIVGHDDMVMRAAARLRPRYEDAGWTWRL